MHALLFKELTICNINKIIFKSVKIKQETKETTVRKK